MNIYLDMDDVVADWHSAAQEYLKLKWSKDGERIPREDWERIKSQSRFYLDLPLMPGAKDLVAYVKDLEYHQRVDEIFFLTALPHDYSMPYAAHDKVWWAHRHFPDIPVFFGPFSHDKWRYCRPGDILIDDRHSNCAEWRAQGGLAHEYRTWAQCKEWLDEQFPRH